MRALEPFLLVSLGCISIGCDPPAPIEDGAGTSRTGTFIEQVETKYFAKKPSCPSYSCGLNSPFIGHELNLDGAPNGALVRYTGAQHLDHGTVSVEVAGDELIARVGASVLTGADLVGLSLELEGEVDGATVALTAKLVEFAWVPMWTTGVADEPPVVPSYKFVYASPGIGNQLLCPSPTEGHSEDPAEVLLAQQQAALFDAGELGDLEELNASLAVTHRPYHAVLFAGERFEFDTAEIYASEQLEWFNWGCAGSSAAKLHLTGHTAAATARAELAKPASADQKQAMLYAYTATYCPGARRMTVPGHPIRIAEAQGLVAREGDVSFVPRASGTVEALWGPHGAECLSLPRLETEDLSVWGEILDACPSIPECPDREELIAADESDNLLNETTSVFTFNLALDSCQGRCGSAGPGFDCTTTCASGGTCSSDYDDVCP